MYFWRIEDLKDRMVSRPLSEREALPYLLVFVGLTALVGFFPNENLNWWDRLGTGYSVLLAVLGTIWIYRQNGGAEGHFFLQRYLAIGWVASIRWMAVLLALCIPFFLMLSLYDIESEVTTWYDFVFLAIVETVLYWRIGAHVRNIAQRTKSV
jgi:hypothetical protein